MVHLLHQDFISAPGLEKEFFLSVLTGVLLTSLVLIVPAIRHLKSKVLYLLKLGYVTGNTAVLIVALWWADWFCGEITCMDHVTGFSRELSPIRLSVHIGLSTLYISYTVSSVTYEVTMNHAWNGQYFRSALGSHNKKLADSISGAPLSVTWLVQQFQGDLAGPNFGFSLQPIFYAVRIMLWISMTGLAIGWLLLAAGNRSSKTGSLLITISGLLQLGVLVFFILLSSRIHRKIFVGYQMLALKYSTIIVWVLPLTGLINTTTGILLMVTKVFCERKSGCLFTPLQVLFVDPVSLQEERHASRATSPETHHHYNREPSLSSLSSAQDSSITTDHVSTDHVVDPMTKMRGHVLDHVTKMKGHVSSDYRPKIVRSTKNRLTSVFERDTTYRTKYVYFNNTSSSSYSVDQDCESTSRDLKHESNDASRCLANQSESSSLSQSESYV
ncbi:uncharacterized protein LOC134823841 [Bolinopsis microptera]|uniref:uncharacterized protein LOC134823841 n=1 Tax=Bolinopsis microptera TaxID=2820187 RepID=UPI003079C0A8